MQHIRKRQQKSIDYFSVYVYVFICYILKATINCFMLKTFNAFQYCNTVLFSSFKSPIFTYIYTRQSQIFVWSINKQNEKEKKQKEGLLCQIVVCLLVILPSLHGLQYYGLFYISRQLLLHLLVLFYFFWFVFIAPVSHCE